MKDNNICTQTEEETAAIFAMSRDDEGCETDVLDINVGNSSEKANKRAAETTKSLPKSSTGKEFRATADLNTTTNTETSWQKKKFEFSKIVFLILFLITVGVTLFAMLLMWKTGSVTPLTYLIPSSYTAFATGTAFYFDKSKKENLIKLRSVYGDEMMDRVREDN